jgi:Mlc titration factor MtfA (ptsG expression regulator)
MKLTYQQLLDKLQKMPAERLQDNVTVLLAGDEFLPVQDFQAVEESDCDVLDEGHFVLVAVGRPLGD